MEVFMDQAKIGKFIAEMRKKQGFTQKKLAEELGISDKTISKWECGNGMPDNGLMLPLCSMLGISVNELLSGELLSKGDYGKKAEENIINLLQKTEDERKRDRRGMIITLVSDIFLVLFLGYLIFISNGSKHAFEYFVNIPALVMVLGLVLLVLLASRLLSSFFKAFRIAFCNQCEPDEEEVQDALSAVRLVFSAAPLAGGVVAVIGFVSTVSKLNDAASIGRNLALAVLSIFYVMLLLLLLLPLKNKLESLQKERKNRKVTEE